MEIIGHYIQPSSGLQIKTPFYQIRYNNQKAHMSDKELGLQVLVLYLGSEMWVNIEPSWLYNQRQEKITCNCCGKKMNQKWELDDDPTKVGGNCTECGRNLCSECSGGFDDDGMCKYCQLEAEEKVSVLLVETSHKRIMIPRSIYKRWREDKNTTLIENYLSSTDSWPDGGAILADEWTVEVDA